jgi:hypothetical protein
MFDMDYYGPFLQWFPVARIAVSFIGTFMFFLSLFILVRGLTRLKLYDGKNKIT